MTAPRVVAAETSTIWPINMRTTELPDGQVVDAVTVWIHRPGDPWAYRVWHGDPEGRHTLVRTKAQLERQFPGLFDAVIVPAFAADLRNVRQAW